MEKQRILILGTYPIYPAMHGGQKRTAAIIEKYEALGHEVKYVSICTPGNYPHYRVNDLRIEKNAMHKAVAPLPSPTFTELVVCRAAAHDDHIVNRFIKLVDRFKPTLVEYEQGYVYEFVKAIENNPLRGVGVIFSSHNVEWQMKQEIALSEGCTAESIATYVEAVRNLEIELLTVAKYCIVVTETDAGVYQVMVKESQAKTLVAHNGINPLQLETADRQYWQSLKSSLGIEKVIIYIASAHPPNFHGFRKLIDGVGFLPGEVRIIVAGGVSDVLRNMAKKTTDIQIATLQNRVVLAGRLSEDRLQGLIAESDVIMLPILEGGGSNLKTAEAIVADKPIVATSHAFRAYEAYEHYPNTYIADKPEAFQQAILKALYAPTVARNEAEQEQATDVTWQRCLMPLETIFE